MPTQQRSKPTTKRDVTLSASAAASSSSTLPPGARSIQARRKRVANAGAVRKQQRQQSATLAHVHVTQESVAAQELTPPHPPREDTPEYQQTHKLLVFDKDTPCKVCGVRHSTIGDPTSNKAGAKALETHHFPCERSLIDALDWRKVHNDFPAVYSQASLVMWVDSPQNMLVLCDVHHRGTETGIHHLLTQDFAVMPYLLDGYRVAASVQDEAEALVKDEQIERAAGIEQAVDQQIAAATTVDVSASSVANITPQPVKAKRKRVRKSKAVAPVASPTKVALA